jgi:hypothetical protein
MAVGPIFKICHSPVASYERERVEIRRKLSSEMWETSGFTLREEREAR